MDERKYGALSSSDDPQKLATTIVGLIKAAGGLVAFLGVSTITGEITSFAEQAGQLVTAGYAFYGLAESCFGLGRKILITLYNQFK